MIAPARYVDLLRDEPITALAAQLGLDLIEHRGTTSPGSFACPACNALKRHGERRRGAVGVRADDRGWKCHECNAAGDSINLVCLVLFGTRDMRSLTDSQRLELSEWANGRAGAPVRPALRLVPRPPPEYPPFQRVAACWRECVPVTNDRDVRDWLVDHCIDPRLVAKLDLARALPANTNGSEWTDAGNRLIVPLRDATGYPRSLKARFVGCGTGDLPKSVSPGGFSAKGLSFFDHRVRASSELWVAEGEKKFLALVTLLGPATAVVGVGSGMYSQELVNRYASVERVFIATDPDVKHKAGARYATDIARMLTPEQWARASHYRELRVTDAEQRVFSTASNEERPQIDDLIESGRIKSRADLESFMSEVRHARAA